MTMTKRGTQSSLCLRMHTRRTSSIMSMKSHQLQSNQTTSKLLKENQIITKSNITIRLDSRRESVTAAQPGGCYSARISLTDFQAVSLSPLYPQGILELSKIPFSGIC